MPENKVYSFFFRRLDAMIPLRKGLDAFALRQKVHASNIANVETPGYNAKRVTFENQLKKAISKRSSAMALTNPNHLPFRHGLKHMERVIPRVVKDDSPEFYNGVNNVDIDKEVARMATNQIHYAAASKVLGIRYRMLKAAILGRS